MATPAGVARPGLFARTVQFYHDVVTEMRKVTWPDRGQVRQATIGIVFVVLAVGLIIALMDIVLQYLLVTLIPKLFGGM
jgi:preprotein translocase subunit SecE